MYFERLPNAGELSIGATHTLNAALAEVEKLVNGLTVSPPLRMNGYAITADDAVDVFVAKITDAAPPLGYTLAAELTPEGTTLVVTSTTPTLTALTEEHRFPASGVTEEEPVEGVTTTTPAAPTLLPPFDVLVGSERLTVTDVSEDGVTWTVERLYDAIAADDDVAIPTYASGTPLVVVGSRPFGFVEQTELLPGYFGDKPGGRTGTIERDSTGKVVRLTSPAFEMRGRDAPVGSIVFMQQSDNATNYLFELAIGEPLYAKLTGSDLTCTDTVTELEELEFGEPEFNGQSIFSLTSPTEFGVLLSIDDDSLSLAITGTEPSAFPYLLLIGNEVVKVSSGAGLSFSIDRERWGTKRPVVEDDEDEYEVGTVVYLLRPKYGWQEVYQDTPGTFTERTDGASDLDFTIPALESGNLWVSTSSNPIVQLWPQMAADGLYYVFSRPANFIVSKMEPGSPTDDAVENVTIIEVDESTGLTFDKAVTTYSQIANDPGCVVLAVHPTDANHAGGLHFDVTLRPWQKLGTGNKTAKAWIVGSVFLGVIVGNGAEGFGFYSNLDEESAATSSPANISAGDVESDGDITSTGTVSGTNLEGHYDGGTF